MTPKERYYALKLEVFSHYCGTEGWAHCMCPGCKVQYLGMLTLDHVNGDGAAHRKAHKLWTGNINTWRWLKRNGYPEGFQALCCNCNHSKGTGKACALAGKSHCGEAVGHVGEIM